MIRVKTRTGRPPRAGTARPQPSARSSKGRRTHAKRRPSPARGAPRAPPAPTKRSRPRAGPGYFTCSDCGRLLPIKLMGNVKRRRCVVCDPGSPGAKSLEAYKETKKDIKKKMEKVRANRSKTCSICSKAIRPGHLRADIAAKENVLICIECKPLKKYQSRRPEAKDFKAPKPKKSPSPIKLYLTGPIGLEKGSSNEKEFLRILESVDGDLKLAKREPRDPARPAGPLYVEIESPTWITFGALAKLKKLLAARDMAVEGRAPEPGTLITLTFDRQRLDGTHTPRRVGRPSRRARPEPPRGQATIDYTAKKITFIKPK